MSGRKLSPSSSSSRSLSYDWSQFFHRVGGFNIASSIMDPEANTKKIIAKIRDLCLNKKCSIINTEELSICGYGCQHGFQFDNLLLSCRQQVRKCMDELADFECIYTLGLPYQVTDGRIFNVAVVIYKGEILGMIPKKYLPNYTMFSEKKYFTSGEGIKIEVNDKILGEFLLSTNQLFSVRTENTSIDFTFAVTICEDDWAPIPVATIHSLAGAHLIMNMSSSPAVVSKHENKLEMFASMTRAQNSALLYTASSCTQPVDEYVNDGMIAAWICGGLISQNELFERESELVVDIDIAKIMIERRVNQTRSDMVFDVKLPEYNTIIIEQTRSSFTNLMQRPNKRPFVPSNPKTMADRAKTIRLIKATALQEKLLSMPGKEKTRVVFGFSAGVDSTDAALTAADTMDRFTRQEIRAKSGKEPTEEEYMARRKQVIGVMMPGSGTTAETNDLSQEFLDLLGFEIRTVDISEMSEYMLKEVMEHPEGVYNTAYESTYARQRTSVLLSIAGEVNGLYFGTGDLSEIAQGWNTFMGDQLAQFNCNAGTPKTLIQFECFSYAEEHPEMEEILHAILDRDISPELIPVDVLEKQGKKAQRSEDTLGDYTLIDFFLFHFLSFKDVKFILYYAIEAFSPNNSTDVNKKTFTPAYIKEFLEKFVRRFYNAQYKRTICSPGPLVGYLSLASREVFRFPDNAKPDSLCAYIRNLEI
jgi:NAD+ synthase (glutamine-hydrolysing)